MKPEGALELSVPADLSYASIGWAEDEAKKELFREVEFDYKNKIDYTIKVNSCDMGHAITMGYVIKGTVEVDFSYHEDEWSLTVGYYDMHPKEFKRHEVTVWSPGA